MCVIDFSGRVSGRGVCALGSVRGRRRVPSRPKSVYRSSPNICIDPAQICFFIDPAQICFIDPAHIFL